MQSYGQADMNQPKSYEGNEFEDEPPLLEGKITKKFEFVF